MSNATAAQPSRLPSRKRMSLADISTAKNNLPSHIILHGVPGIGKTSMPSFAAAPVFLCSQLEMGAQSLKNAGLIPEHVGIFPECQTWAQALEAIELLTQEEHAYRTLVLDVLNGFEKLVHEHVCQRDYNGKHASFNAYKAGQNVAVADWRQMLAALDRLREAKRMQIVLLAHTKVTNFKNPEGPDYDRYQPDLCPETWAVTHGWADVCLFLNYDVDAKSEQRGQKAKGVGGMSRLIYTSRTAAWDGKNRNNLPPVISMGNNGKEAWENLVAEMRKSISQAKGGDV